MNRRNFVKVAVGAGVGAIAVPKAAFAAASDSSMAGGVYYTRENPGRWGKKIGGHMPTVNIKTDGNKTTVGVVTAHEMKGYEHYIVKHMLLDSNYQFIAEKMFDPAKDSPISSFDLEDYKGKIYALSMCNKHDTWIAAAEV